MELDEWKAAENSAANGDLKSANTMRMFALARVLAAAETAILLGDALSATTSLRQLERYASLMADEIDPVAACN